MLEVSYSYGEYINDTAPLLLLYYVSMNHEGRTLLFSYSPNLIGTVPEMANQIIYTQQLFFRQSSGWQRMYHLVITISTKDKLDRNKLMDLAAMISSYFSYAGFQLAYGVFTNNATKQTELHFAISSISVTGAKFFVSNNVILEQQDLFSSYLKFAKGPS